MCMVNGNEVDVVIFSKCKGAVVSIVVEFQYQC